MTTFQALAKLPDARQFEGLGAEEAAAMHELLAKLLVEQDAATRREIAESLKRSADYQAATRGRGVTPAKALRDAAHELRAPTTRGT